MEETKALNRLGEATDLLILLEDILNPTSMERLSPSAWSGLRLTLKNARAMLQESQNILSKDYVARAKTGATTIVTSDLPHRAIETEHAPANNEQAKALITRRDLKASLEKFIESRA